MALFIFSRDWSAKWHATQCPGDTSRKGGSFWKHTSWLIQHLEANRQIGLGLIGLGTSPYDADTICQRVTSRVQQGSIVLFHNAALHTPEALPAILTCLINDGYTVVPISQLILPQPYTIDHTGRQFPAETGA